MKDLTLKQRRAEATLANLKNAAIRVVLREGVMEFTTAQIAAEAGVSIGTMYRYFKNRSDVLDTLVPGFTDRQTDDFQFQLQKMQEDDQDAAKSSTGNNPPLMYTGILRAS